MENNYMQKYYNFRQNCIFIVTLFTVKRSDFDQSARGLAAFKYKPE